MSKWPNWERFHYRTCAKMKYEPSPCDCGGDDYVKRMEARHEYLIENNQREAIAEISDYGILRLGAEQ